MNCSKEPGSQQEVDRPPVNKLVLDVETSQVWFLGLHLIFTPIEFQLLLILARNLGLIVTKARIYDYLWPRTQEVYAKQIADHASRIRRHFAGLDKEPRIDAVYGIGYRLRLPTHVTLEVIEVDPHYLSHSPD